MTDLTRKVLRGLSFAGFLLGGWFAIQLTHIFETNAWAGTPLSPKSIKAGSLIGFPWKKAFEHTTWR